MVATATVVAQANTDYGSPTAARTTDAPFTPTANSKLYVVAGSVDASHATAKSWTVSGGGLSWSLIANSADSETPVFSATDTTWGATVWWADVGASPSSMDVTVDPHATADQGYPGFTVFEVLGATPGVAGNVQAAVAGFSTNPTPVSVSLGSGLTAGSVVLGGWFLLSDGGTSAYDGTVPSGWSRTLITEVAGVSVAGMISTTQNSLTYGSAANTAYTAGFLIEVGEASAAATLDQEGFRWGVDDDTEADHTWAAAQDGDLTAALGSQLLRVLVDATNDPASVAYTLRAQQNGAGGYVAVPVGAGGDVPPLIEAGDVTTSGSNTAQSSWAVSTPAASTGDLLVMCLGWDDSVTTSDATPANGPNGETWTRVGAVVGSASTEVRATVWRTIATGSWSAGTVTVTPTATESWIARVFRVPAGEFDATTPIGAADEVASAGTAETGVDSPALTAGSSDGGGTLVNWSIADADPQTVNGSGWTGISTQDIGVHSCALAVRDAATTDSESISSVQVATIAGDSWCSVGFIVRGVSVTNELYVAASANITAGGEATTARLTAPSGKSSSDFTAGRRWDDENGTDSIDIAADFYTEVGWSLATQAPATDGDYWDFRVYAGASPLDTYTEEPRLTIGTSGVTVELGGVTETDTPGSVSIGKTVELGPAVETAAAGDVVVTIEVALGPVVEAATAGAVEVSKVVALGPAVESDAVGAATVTKTVELGPAVEVSSAGAVEVDLVILVELGPAGEISSAGAVEISKTVELGAAVETVTAGAVEVSKVVELGPAVEADLAGPVEVTVTVELGGATETATAGPVEVVKLVELGPAVETSSVGPVTVSKLVAVDPVTETATAGPVVVQVAGTTTVPLGPATESDTVGPATITKTVELGGAVETASVGAVSVDVVVLVELGGVTESGTVGPVTISKLVELGPAVESGSAGALGLSVLVELGGAVDVATVGPVEISKTVDVGPAGEVSSVGGISITFPGAIRAPVSSSVAGVELVSGVAWVGLASRVEAVELVSRVEAVGMVELDIESTTDEGVRVVLTSSANPVAVAPSFAVTEGTRVDPPATWEAGTWQGDWNSRTGLVAAVSPGIGEGQTLDVGPGVWDLWVKWTDGQRHPVKLAARVVVR